MKRKFLATLIFILFAGGLFPLIHHKTVERGGLPAGTAFSSWYMMTPAEYAMAETYYGSPPQKIIEYGDSSSAVVLIHTVAIIKLERANLAMTLWKRTDGTSDTLLVRIDQTNDLTDPDTLKWVPLTAFGGTKPDTVHAHRIYFGSPVVSDTTHPVGRFLRIRSNHLGVSTVKQLATDSSTWELWFTSWGDPLK